MDKKTQKIILYSGLGLGGLVFIYFLLRGGKSGGVSSVTNQGGDSTGADGSSLTIGDTLVAPPNITINGGVTGGSWNPGYNQPTGGSTTELNLPVITNYNGSQSGDCSSCSSGAPDLYYATVAAAQAAMAKAMTQQSFPNSYWKGNVLYQGGYSGDDVNNLMIGY